ncbi:Type I Iterative PKS [Arachnomyces sp. PD_36]|nr:Type I Iterative PKS [Arachnomyces sp. PD_36]
MTDMPSTQAMRDASKTPNFPSTAERVGSADMDASPPPYSEHAVAVTGMACQFAGAKSLEQLWEILETGTSAHRDLPKDRFPDWRFERRNYSRNFQAATLDDVDAFDHKFFKVASREATFMDPQQRLGIQVIYQALESAGYFNRDDSQAEQDIGCYMATCINEYADHVACHSPSAFSLTGSIRPFIAGKISHHFGWTGPAIMYDTACAASGTALHQACRAVASGECQGAVVGATNIFVVPDTFQNLAAGQFTSPTGPSKAFDAAADGYCRGEGVAAVVLKKLSVALRDGDPILGVVSATGVNQNANDSNITLPNGRSQMNLYRKTLRLAGLDADHVSYVEAHGTGTARGDPIEAGSIRTVFGNSDRPSGQTTYMGSLKSNIGHTEATSGLSGLIKVLLMMQKGVIPGQALLKNINPAIEPLEPVGMKITTENVPWTAKFKVACVNNYGASGTNAAMVVTQPPDMSSAMGSSSSAVPTLNATYPVSITAFSPSSLASYCSELLNFINTQSGIPSNDLTRRIAYHLGRRRNPKLPYSASATVSSLQQLKHLLSSTISGESHTKGPDIKRPVVLFFGGQTGKIASVSRAVYDSVAIFRKHLDDCDAALQELGSPSIFPAVFEAGPHHDVVLLHSILFSAQYASAMAWLDCGLKPARVTGHSFGQLTAMCISGVLSLDDGLRLVTERARLIREHWGNDSGSMIAIEADPSTASQILIQHSSLNLDIACYNGPHSVVFAGSTSSIDALEESLASSRQRLRSKRLQVTHAFHSSLTEPLLRPLQRIAEQLTFHDAKIPLETCSEGNTWQSVTPPLIASHLRDPVYFNDAVTRISEQLGPCVWLEAGPVSGSSMLRRALGPQLSSHDVISLALDAASSIDSVAETTADLWRLRVGVEHWPFHNSQHHEYKALNLPPYQFDKARFWLDWQELGTAPAPAVAEAQHPKQPPPLLQLVQETGTGAEFRINTQCDEWRTMCAEHHIMGVPICPLSSLLNLVRDSIDKKQQQQTPPTGKPVVYNLQSFESQSIVPAITSNGSLSLFITNDANHPQSWAFVVRDALATSNTEYASGTVSASATDNDNKSRAEFARFERLVDIAQIQALSHDLEADSVQGKAVYRSVTDWFQCPKSGQGIKQVSAKGNEAAAYLTPTSPDAFSSLESFLHAPLICLNSLRDRQENGVNICTSIGDAKFKDPIGFASDQVNKSWALYLKFFDLGGRESTCDIFAFDVQRNQLSAVVLDVTFVKTDIESLQLTPGIGQDLGPEKTILDTHGSSTSNHHQPITEGGVSHSSNAIPKTHDSPISYPRQIAKSDACHSRTVLNTPDSRTSYPQSAVDGGDVDFLKTVSDTYGNPTSCRQPIADIDMGYYSESLEETNQSAKSPRTLELPLNDYTPEQPCVSSELIKSVYDLLARVADVEHDALRPDALIVDLGIDSLMGMEVAEEISKAFSISIGVREFESLRDVDSLCQLLAARAGGFSEGSDSAAPGTQSVVRDTFESRETLSTSSVPITHQFSEATNGSKRVNKPVSQPPTSIGDLSNAAGQAFDQIRDKFDFIARNTGCDQFCSQVYPQQASLIVAYITEAFTKLGCDLSSIKPGQKVPKVPHLYKNNKLVARLMRALGDDNLITQAGNDWLRTSKPISTQPSSSERYNRLMASFPQFAPEHKLLHIVGAKLADCLSGEVDPLALLFGSAEKRALMADQYLTAPIQRSVSQQLASFITQCFGSQNIQSTLRVLEIGGGTCGTTLPAVKAFAELGIPVEYTFSDVSSSFVAAAKAKLRDYKFVQFRLVDVTEVPSHDQRGYYDMIIATNVLHATPDVCQSAGNARQMLRPEGILTLVEYTWRDYYLLDVIFGQLEGWWLFNDGRDHATMDSSGWKTTLKRAGFTEVDWTQGQSPESEICRIFLAYN